MFKEIIKLGNEKVFIFINNNSSRVVKIILFKYNGDFVNYILFSILDRVMNGLFVGILVLLFSLFFYLKFKKIKNNSK